MSHNDQSWDPADGPEPTDDERADAKAVSDALSNGPNSPRRTQDADLDAIVDVGLRVHATAHPDTNRAKSVASAAVEYAVTHAGQRWYRSRWRWAAVAAAALVVGVGGSRLATLRGSDDPGIAISRPASDVFSAPLGDSPGSGPIGQITESRMRSYRDVMFHFGPRRTP